MNLKQKITQTLEERPKRTLASIFLILFWIAAPLTAQIYFNYSAINTSFLITIIYYLGMKAYKYRKNKSEPYN